MTFQNRLKPTLIYKHNEQRGRCAYCYQPLWIKALEPQGMAMLRMRYVREEKADYTSSLGWQKGEPDHVIPVSEGGSDDPENIVAACNYCNRGRDTKPVAEWFAQIQGTQHIVHEAGFLLPYVLYLEVAAQEVRDVCQGLFSDTRVEVRPSIATIYPLYRGSAAEIDRTYVFNKRQNLMGSRVGFTQSEERDRLCKEFPDKIYRGPFAQTAV